MAIGLIPDFGKMKQAVRRVKDGGSVEPLASGKEMGDDASVGSGDITEGMPHRMINFFVPVIVWLEQRHFPDWILWLELLLH